MTYTLDWSETNLGGSAVDSYARGTILDFTDKPVGATAALSCTAAMGATDHMLAVFTIETSGSSLMTFDYKISTEAGWDKLHIDVDGVSQANYSGIVAWTSHPGISIPTAGVHTIRFRYSKDAGDVNADRVWIAKLNITNTVTVNDASGTVTTSDMEDGAIPAAVTTSTWTNSTSAPIAGTRSLRSPASPANSASYDLTVTKPAGGNYGTVGFDYKVSTEAGWDKLQVFPNPAAAGKVEFSGTASGRLAVILPPAESSVLFRYVKDGGGAGGADAVWIDNLSLPAAGGGGITGSLSAAVPRARSTLAGTATGPSYTGALSAPVPRARSTIAGTATAPSSSGTISAAAPRARSTITGTATAPTYSGSVSASVPVATGSLSGTSSPPVYAGTLSAAIPPTRSTITGTVTAPAGAATLSASLPRAIGGLTGTVTAPVWSGALDGDLAPVTGTILGIVTGPVFSGTIDASLPSLTGAAAGTSTVPSATGVLVAELPSLVGALTGVVAVDPSTLRDVDVLFVGTRLRDVAISTRARPLAVEHRQRPVTPQERP